MKTRHVIYGATLIISIFVCCANAQNATPTAVAPEKECIDRNSSCEDCIKDKKCLWCPTRPDACSPYPKGKLLPPKDYCSLADARWGTCWVNYKILLIAMGAVAGIIFLSISCCCLYCCCCRNKDGARKKLEEEEMKSEQKDKDRKAKSSDKKKERESKYEEIRRKYGLQKDTPYEKFTEEA